MDARLPSIEAMTSAFGSLGRFPVTLPSGTRVSLPRATPQFRRWTGARPSDTYGSKLVLDCRGRVAFAELAILWSLEAAGWSGAWVDSYRHRYRSGYWGDPPDVVLPKPVTQILTQIRQRAWVARGGTFDVVAWKGRDLLFAESKRARHDRIRDTQLRWVEAALGCGLRTDQLFIVEWNVAAT